MPFSVGVNIENSFLKQSKEKSLICWSPHCEQSCSVTEFYFYLLLYSFTLY